MKKSVISSLLLGFVLLSAMIVFIATVADDLVIDNKIRKLKEITDNTALALGKHYILNYDIASAEIVANELLDQTVLGSEIKDSLIYTWDILSDPKSVIVTLPTYTHQTFWYRFMKKNSFLLDGIESKVEIIASPFTRRSEILAPLAINRCDRDDLIIGTEIDFTFQISDNYDSSNVDEFYAVDKACTFPSGNSNFSYFLNHFNSGEVTFTIYDLLEEENACLVQTSLGNDPLNVDSKQLENKLKHFSLPYRMDIVLFECGTTANNLIIRRALGIEIIDVTLVNSNAGGNGNGGGGNGNGNGGGGNGGGGNGNGNGGGGNGGGGNGNGNGGGGNGGGGNGNGNGGGGNGGGGNGNGNGGGGNGGGGNGNGNGGGGNGGGVEKSLIIRVEIVPAVIEAVLAY